MANPTWRKMSRDTHHGGCVDRDRVRYTRVTAFWYFPGDGTWHYV